MLQGYTAKICRLQGLFGACRIHIPQAISPLEKKLAKPVGDLLVIRANTAINREDFDIQKGKFEDKVSPTVNLTLSIAGAAPKQ